MICLIFVCLTIFVLFCCFCIFLFMLFHMYFCHPEKAESFYLLDHLCIREIICMMHILMLISHSWSVIIADVKMSYSGFRENY